MHDCSGRVVANGLADLRSNLDMLDAIDVYYRKSIVRDYVLRLRIYGFTLFLFPPHCEVIDDFDICNSRLSVMELSGLSVFCRLVKGGITDNPRIFSFCSRHFLLLYLHIKKN